MINILKKSNLITHYQKLKYFKNPRDYVALDPSHSLNKLEFDQYGNRLAAYLSRRFEIHAEKPLEYLNLLEIGCGMGRLLKPFSTRYNFVTGVDISNEILQAAEEHLKGVNNYNLIENNGLDLSVIDSNSMDLVLTGGVLQHIPSRSIISGYIVEALRILKTHGLFLFTFQVWQTNIEGKNRVGAKFSADWLNNIFQDLNAKILEICYDDKDPIPHFSVIVKKTNSKFQDDFNEFKTQIIPWRTMCWQGLETKKIDLEISKSQPQRKITFYEKEKL